MFCWTYTAIVLTFRLPVYINLGTYTLASHPITQNPKLNPV